jgi:hypothetical protein
MWKKGVFAWWEWRKPQKTSVRITRIQDQNKMFRGHNCSAQADITCKKRMKVFCHCICNKGLGKMQWWNTFTYLWDQHESHDTVRKLNYSQVNGTCFSRWSWHQLHWVTHSYFLLIIVWLHVTSTMNCLNCGLTCFSQTLLNYILA